MKKLPSSFLSREWKRTRRYKSKKIDFFFFSEMFLQKKMKKVRDVREH